MTDCPVGGAAGEEIGHTSGAGGVGDSNAFYRAFVDHYDALFGVDDDTLSRISSSTPSGGSVLDVGCGTGGYVRRLLTMGFEAWGIDLSPEMITRAAAADPSRADRYAVADMRDVGNLPVFFGGGGRGGNPAAGGATGVRGGATAGDTPGRKHPASLGYGQFDVVFSVGNTISHLASYDEVARWFTSVRHILRDNGVLIVRFVDVSNLAVGAFRDLPTLSGSAAGTAGAADPTRLGDAPVRDATVPKVTMRRRYTRVSERSIRFDASISVEEGEERRTAMNLLLLTPDGVRDMFSRAGFSVIEHSAGWAPLFSAVV